MIMGSNQALLTLNKASQIRYALRHVRMLPPPYQSDDSNRITFGLFALCSLCMLGGLDRLDESERDDYVDWILGTWDDTIGGFGGAPKQQLRPYSPDDFHYDQPHLTHTYTALLILALLTVPESDQPGVNKSPYVNLNVTKLVSFVSNCQRPNGSFGSFPSSPDEDVRFVYCAIAILTMVRVDLRTVIDVKSTLSFLKSCRRYEGGYGQSPYAEAQGGTTYCVIASLAMLNELEQSLTSGERAKTIRWLVDRQGELTTPPRESDDVSLLFECHLSSADSCSPLPQRPNPFAGFQGRIGKPLDACYSFWCTGALTIMAKHINTQSPSPVTQHTKVPVSSTSPILYDPEANIKFLLLCQSKQWGGIARSPDDHPGHDLDVYHTYLALSSLSLSHTASIQQNHSKEYKDDANSEEDFKVDFLLDHDPLLNVPIKVSDWIYRCFASL